MVNSTAGSYVLGVRRTRNSREVHQFAHNVRIGMPPLSSQSENTSEAVQTHESKADGLGPSASQSRPESNVTFVVQESASPIQAPAAKQTLLVNDMHDCVQSSAGVMAPVVKASATIAQAELPVIENATNGLDPHIAGDKLEGYVPQFFLKEDGKDDIP